MAKLSISYHYFDPITREACSKRAYLKSLAAIVTEVERRTGMVICVTDEIGNTVGSKNAGLLLPFWIAKKMYEALLAQLPSRDTFDEVLTVSKTSTSSVTPIAGSRVAKLWKYAHERLRAVELGPLAYGRTVILTRLTDGMSSYEVTWKSLKGTQITLQGIRGNECGFRDFIDAGFELKGAV